MHSGHKSFVECVHYLEHSDWNVCVVEMQFSLFIFLLWANLTKAQVHLVYDDVLLKHYASCCVISTHCSVSISYMFACLLLRCCSVEADKQRTELHQQHEAEQKATIDQLTSLKDAEMAALKQGWQHKVNELLQEVDILHYCCCNCSICFHTLFVLGSWHSFDFLLTRCIAGYKIV